MATLSINIPANQVSRVEDNFALAYGYQETIPDPQDNTKTIPNPESKTAFSKRMVIQYIKEVVQGQERKTAEQAITNSDVPLT